MPLPPTSTCPHAPKEVCLSQGGQQSMFLRRRVHSIRIRIILILFWLLEVRACSLCMFVLYRTLLLRGKGSSCQFTVPKGTDEVFIRYRFDKYQEIPTEYQPKILNWYINLEKRASLLSPGTQECVHLVPKNLRHGPVGFETRAHTISFLYQNH
jgi:hypothetical protein